MTRPYSYQEARIRCMCVSMLPATLYHFGSSVLAHPCSSVALYGSFAILLQLSPSVAKACSSVPSFVGFSTLAESSSSCALLSSWCSSFANWRKRCCRRPPHSRNHRCHQDIETIRRLSICGTGFGLQWLLFAFPFAAPRCISVYFPARSSASPVKATSLMCAF